MKEALIICTPVRDTLRPETEESLRRLDGIPAQFLRVVGKPVDEARNEIAARALRHAGPHDLILWVDADAAWGVGTVQRMVDIMRARPDIDILSCACSPRVPYCSPVGRRKARSRKSVLKPGDFVNNKLVRIERGGFHFTMMRPSVLKRVGPDPFAVPFGTADGEDHWFCRRAIAHGCKFFVSGECVVAHVNEDGVAFLPGRGPGRIVRGEFVEDQPGLSPQLTHARFAKQTRYERSYGPVVDAARREARKIFMKDNHGN